VADEPALPEFDEIERALLGSKRLYTRAEVAAKADLPLDLAEELWQRLGFPHTADDDVAFTKEDVTALELTRDLIALGILTPDSQAAMVRTWGRSFARLAEWQVTLLTELALEGEDPQARLGELLDAVLPNVELLQAYVWRRHLAASASRVLGSFSEGGTRSTLAVGFVDIVGYTTHSKNLNDHELVEWVEYFEDEMTRIIVDLGGRVIKTIGDEVLFVAEDPIAAAETALIVTERGEDEKDKFPAVRAGVAYGEVVSRLGDVYGPTVNIASRLTSIARPGSVLVDRGAYEHLSTVLADDQVDPDTGQIPAIGRLIERAADELAELSPYSEVGDYRFRKMPRRSVKGYSRLEPWVLRRSRSRVDAKGDAKGEGDHSD
jgi:adenylate cyclase